MSIEQAPADVDKSATKIPPETGLIDVFVSLLQQRLEQVQARLESSPQIKTLEQDLANLKKNHC